MFWECILGTGVFITKIGFSYYYPLYICFLVTVLLSLSLVGGVVFQIVESPPERRITEAILVQRSSTLATLSTKAKDHRLDVQSKKAEVTLELQLYEGQYIGAIRNGTVILNGKEDPLWTFPGAVYYCVTTFSLVGYGNMAPKTNLGRAIAILYCGLTIPLTSLILGELGELLLLAFDYIWMNVCHRYLGSLVSNQPDETKLAAAQANSTNTNNANEYDYTDYSVRIKYTSKSGASQVAGCSHQSRFTSNKIYQSKIMWRKVSDFTRGDLNSCTTLRNNINAFDNSFSEYLENLNSFECVEKGFKINDITAWGIKVRSYSGHLQQSSRIRNTSNSSDSLPSLLTAVIFMLPVKGLARCSGKNYHKRHLITKLVKKIMLQSSGYICSEDGRLLCWLSCEEEICVYFLNPHYKKGWFCFFNSGSKLGEMFSARLPLDIKLLPTVKELENEQRIYIQSISNFISKSLQMIIANQMMQLRHPASLLSILRTEHAMPNDKSVIISRKSTLSGQSECKKTDFLNLQKSPYFSKKLSEMWTYIKMKRPNKNSQSKTSVTEDNQSLYQCFKTVVNMMLHKRVGVSSPVALFWLGTPFKFLYIGRLLRMCIKKCKAEPSTCSSEAVLASNVGKVQNKTKDKSNNAADSSASGTDVGEEEEESLIIKASTEPVLLTIGTTFVYITIGSLFLAKASNNMSFFDAFWFFFISMVTIGYGDVVPTDQYLFALLLGYIFIGLCIMSNLIGETSVFFSANVSKTKSIGSDFISIVTKKHQLVLVNRQAERAKKNWSILRDRVATKKIPQHLIDESTKYKSGLLLEERELIRWAYKAYFKNDAPVAESQIGGASTVTTVTEKTGATDTTLTKADRRLRFSPIQNVSLLNLAKEKIDRGVLSYFNSFHRSKKVEVENVTELDKKTPHEHLHHVPLQKKRSSLKQQNIFKF